MIKNKLVFNDSTDWAFNLKKAKGGVIWAKDGQELIDFTSAWNVVNLGWNNEEVAEAMVKQIRENVQGILWSSDEIQVKYADALTKVLPKSLDTVVRATGGTEANEEALKTARAFTGRKKFGMEIENIVPDIVTFAKGLSNGAAAIGTMVTRKEIIEATIGQTNLTSTFGWVPVGCAAGLKVLEIHQREKVWEKSQEDGQYIMDFLKQKALPHPKVGDVRGLGMEIGLDIVKDKFTKGADPEAAKKLVAEAYKNGLHIVLGDGGNIQLMPPLTIERETLDAGLNILINCLQSI
jgi:4-aminobutyrate aminotransferase-like enzyme